MAKPSPEQSRAERFQRTFTKAVQAPDRAPYAFCNVTVVHVHGAVVMLTLGESNGPEHFIPRTYAAMAIGDARNLRDQLTGQILAAEALADNLPADLKRPQAPLVPPETKA